MAQGRSRGEVIASVLEHYRGRTDGSYQGTPDVYKRIRQDLEDIKAEGKRILVGIRDSYSVQSTVMYLDYIQDRWAKGHSICYLEGREIKVPHTIHFSDIYCSRLNVKVVVEGDNPFDKT